MALSPEHYIAILGCLLIIIEYIVLVFVFVMRTRAKVFNKDFMQKFDELHGMHFENQKAPALGYPDTGNGRYSQSLSYIDWYRINCAQRIHVNFLEQIHLILLCAIVAGIRYPWPAFAIDIVYVFGRLIYSIGYSTSPDKRVIGALTIDLALLSQFGLAIASCVRCFYLETDIPEAIKPQ